MFYYKNTLFQKRRKDKRKNKKKKKKKKEKEKETKSKKDVTPTFVFSPATSGVPGESPLVPRRWELQ